MDQQFVAGDWSLKIKEYSQEESDAILERKTQIKKYLPF